MSIYGGPHIYPNKYTNYCVFVTWHLLVHSYIFHICNSLSSFLFLGIMSYYTLLPSSFILFYWLAHKCILCFSSIILFPYWYFVVYTIYSWSFPPILVNLTHLEGILLLFEGNLLLILILLPFGIFEIMSYNVMYTSLLKSWVVQVMDWSPINLQWNDLLVDCLYPHDWCIVDVGLIIWPCLWSFVPCIFFSWELW